MEEETVSDDQQINVRLSHSLRLSTAVAIGSSVTVGLSVYLFLGPIFADSGTQTPATYLVTLIFFLPIVLALAERSSVTPGRGGLFNLSRGSGSVALAFSTGWALVGGLIGLAALFALEGGLALSQMFVLFLEIELESRWLSVLLILLIAVRQMSNGAHSWKRRTGFVYATIILLGVILLAAWLQSTETPPTWAYVPTSTLFAYLPFLGISLWGMLN